MHDGCVEVSVVSLSAPDHLHTKNEGGLVRDPLRRIWDLLSARLSLVGFMALASTALARESVASLPAPWPGLTYTNYRVTSIPWSIHVVQVDRFSHQYAFHAVHAQGRALGLGTLRSTLSFLKPALGLPVAAINGDFHQRDRSYAGLPRGLQVTDHEILSAPSGGVSFWIDALDEPHAASVNSRFAVTWPDGRQTRFGLNGSRKANEVELYTPAVGSSTHTSGGRELILVQEGKSWLPLRMGRSCSARVREIRDRGDTRLELNILVLSLGPKIAPGFANVGVGAVVGISTASLPSLMGAGTAISGGPVLVREGKRQRIRPSSDDSYEFTSMSERHPRAAVGWNERAYFLVEVDGRQRNLSVGMTLDELASFMVRLGCREAINLDGGGSATFWYDGHVRNRPCDGHERNIANALVVVLKTNRMTQDTRSAAAEGN